MNYEEAMERHFHVAWIRDFKLAWCKVACKGDFRNCKKECHIKDLDVDTANKYTIADMVKYKRKKEKR